MDLGKLEKVMAKVYRPDHPFAYELDDFGRHKLSSAYHWLACIFDCGGLVGPVDQSIIWNNMPSRNSYCYVPLHDAASARLMDVDSVQDQHDINLAVNLCRIVSRALEFSAFQTLQREVNELAKKRHTKEHMETLLRHLIQMLFSLRWRVAWWQVIGTGTNPGDDQGAAHAERVTTLSQTLYFWYWVVRKRLAGERPTTDKGIWNYYADSAKPVLDDFPVDDTVEGFDAWMAHGRQLIRDADIQPVMPQLVHSYQA